MIDQAVTLLIIISFIDLALGLFVLYKNPKNKINISFSLFSIAILVWINSSYLEDEFSNPKIMNFFLRLDFTSGVFAAIFLLLFCLDIAKTKITNGRYFRKLLIAVPIILAPVIFFTKFIISGYEITQIKSIDPIYGFGGIIYDLLIGIALIAGIGVIAWKFRKATSEEKSKFIYLFVGVFLSGFFVLLTNIILTDYIRNSFNYNYYSRLGIFSTIFIVLFSGYSIIKHHLLNIKTIAAEILSLGILVISLFQVLTAENISDLIVNIIIFLVLIIFIILLVRSIENEVKRKEELQIMSDRLATANDQLRKLDNAKSDFISIASHQLRTPLTAVKGFVSLLMEGTYGDINAKARDALNKVYISNERLIQLVENLLNVSRMESGRIEYEFKKGKIEDVLDEIKDNLLFIARKKGLYLNFNLPKEPLPEIKMDFDKMREVLTNLIDNGIKYASRGGVTVRAELAAANLQLTTNNPQLIRITVSDTGIGIPKDSLPYLFEKFSRGKDTARLHATGTGLGLYVAKNIVEAHHGKLWAESEGEGKGSRFILELPV